MSKDDESHFKGGPMPADAQKAIAAQMQKAGQQGGGPGGPPPAAVGKP